MEEKFNLNQLLQKPIAMMTGEELCFLITKSVEYFYAPSAHFLQLADMMIPNGYQKMTHLF